MYILEMEMGWAINEFCNMYHKMMTMIIMMFHIPHASWTRLNSHIVHVETLYSVWEVH